MAEVENQPALEAGAAQVCITPPVGTQLAGYFHQRVSESVRDDLFARALVLRQGNAAVALVSCDLICIEKGFAQPAKERIAARTGIPPENVLLCATHTHTGPEVRPGRICEVNEPWLERLPGLIADAVVTADQSRFAAQLSPARGSEGDLSFNRLFRMKDATELFGRGPAGSAIGPAGGIDPEVLVLKVSDSEGRPRAFVVNHALHVDVIGGGGGRFLSADWPGEMARALSAIYGQDVVTLFLNGCCGDINHVPHQPTSLPRSGPAKSVQLGRAFAGVAMNAAEKAEPVAVDRIAARLEELAIPYYTRESAMRAYVDSLREKPNRSDFEEYTIKAFDEWPLDGQMATVPVQAFRVGEIAFVGLPGEIFVAHGLEVKKWSPAAFTFIAELANDWFGYVPTTDQAERGAYGARPILSRRLSSDAGRRMTDAIQKALWKLWEEDAGQ
ncbi:MAG TPA: hypothetical protein PLU39_14665 [Armatimonadota bacterium]|nr:hypothetical protein [Armatimonadota bacterium]HOJ21068.1 hypothetical protein [Armatimonadota bacterium]HOM83722.1 hypothetical protein [Armatimonadota bacterium]HPO74278.1 hypothetical protein [Armatimonadota bacterium]HPT99107.1 hypothetical protein [Armatimonadota bacterium]